MRDISRFRSDLSRSAGHELHAAFANRLATGAHTLSKHGDRVHFTASALVVDEPMEQIALVHHRKALMWLQPGGHVEEADASFADAARREVAEELGLRDLAIVGDGPARLHTHLMGSAFKDCAEHWDVQYLFRCAGRPELRLSGESNRVAWFPLGELPEGIVPDLPPLLAQLGLITP
ncbi:NUDIX hydrolase [Dermabacteraceae bacterium P13077]